ncbi:hypothetical protein [Streptomyces sp. NPDC026659]|uniref:hypothetical protein n=1 Tax=Streptomyces sp. NPDC026659 TaxID=3155123 RepID=UPI0033DD9C36
MAPGEDGHRTFGLDDVDGDVEIRYAEELHSPLLPHAQQIRVHHLGPDEPRRLSGGIGTRLGAADRHPGSPSPLVRPVPPA